jgi:hypothetical protein
MYVNHSAKGLYIQAYLHVFKKLKPIFHSNRIVPKSGTNDFDTKENATVCYDTVEMENRLKRMYIDSYLFS